MSRHSLRRFATAGLVAMIVTAVPQAALAAKGDKQQLHDFETGAVVTGSWSRLTRTQDSLRSQVRTRVEPRHAFTFWYVIFNSPQHCDGACDGGDIFGDDVVGGVGWNLEQIEAAQVSVIWAGDGGVSNRAGRLALDGGIAEGQTRAPNQIVIGHPDDDPFFAISPVTGLLDAQAAEVHVVVRDHGVAAADAAFRTLQTSTFDACNPDCGDVQAAVHLP